MIVPELEHELRKLASVTDLVEEWAEIEEELKVIRDALLFETEIKEALGSTDTAAFEPWTDAERAEWAREAETMMLNSDRISRRQRELVHRIRTIADEVDASFHPLWGRHSPSCRKWQKARVTRLLISRRPS